MQKFLSLLFSRRALAIVGVLVLALLVWFVGPLVSFDTLRRGRCDHCPVGSRVVTISSALLLMLLVLWLVNVCAGRWFHRVNAFCMSCRGSWWSAVPATAKPRPC